MDVELNRAEAELQHEESALHTELSRLAEVSGELSERLAALSTRAASLGDAGLAQRARAEPPAVDAVGAFANARTAREAAVRLRRDTNAAIRQQLAATKAQLQKLAQQVLTDEQHAQQLEAQAKQARAEAQRAAAAPPPPPPAARVVAAPPPPPREQAPGSKPQPQAAKEPQRQRPRVRMQAAVDVHSDANFFNGFSANISDGGLFVATVNLVPLGTEVDLSFTLPSGARIETRGVVRWVREVNDKHHDAFPGIGVQFKDLEPHALQAIEAFLAEREPLFYA